MSLGRVWREILRLNLWAHTVCVCGGRGEGCGLQSQSSNAFQFIVMRRSLEVVPQRTANVSGFSGGPRVSMKPKPPIDSALIVTSRTQACPMGALKPLHACELCDLLHHRIAVSGAPGRARVWLGLSARAAVMFPNKKQRSVFLCGSLARAHRHAPMLLLSVSPHKRWCVYNSAPLHTVKGGFVFSLSQTDILKFKEQIYMFGG